MYQSLPWSLSEIQREPRKLDDLRYILTEYHPQKNDKTYQEQVNIFIYILDNVYYNDIIIDALVKLSGLHVDVLNQNVKFKKWLLSKLKSLKIDARRILEHQCTYCGSISQPRFIDDGGEIFCSFSCADKFPCNGDVPFNPNVNLEQLDYQLAQYASFAV